MPVPIDKNPACKNQQSLVGYRQAVPAGENTAELAGVPFLFRGLTLRPQIICEGGGDMEITLTFSVSDICQIILAIAAIVSLWDNKKK